MVSELRKESRLARVSVIDVYEHPTIDSLAAALDAAAPRSQPSADEPRACSREERVSGDGRGRHFLAGILQSAGLYFVFGFKALQWVTPYLVYFLLEADEYPALESAQ